MPNRREVLEGGAAAALAAVLPARAWAAKSPLIVNALGGLENPNLELDQAGEFPPGGKALQIDRRALREAHESGLSAVNITLGYVSGPKDPHDYTVQTLDEWDAVLAGSPDDLMLVRKAADLQSAKAAGKVGVIYGMQNAVQVGADLDHADEYAGRGVRVIQLTYNPANMLGDGSMAPENRGVSPLGRQVIERLNDLRIMVDLSHSGERTCLDAIAASKAPLSINHTGCRALTDLPRNKTDAELRGVAEKGGFVGVYFMPFLTLDGHPHATDVVAHIRHALDVCGEDHVGIGTDGGVTGIDDLGVYQAALEKEVAERAAAGIGAKGERADTYPFVVDLRGVDQFHKLARLLGEAGVKPRVVDKILGLNFARYAERVWG